MILWVREEMEITGGSLSSMIGRDHRELGSVLMMSFNLLSEREFWYVDLGGFWHGLAGELFGFQLMASRRRRFMEQGREKKKSVEVADMMRSGPGDQGLPVRRTERRERKKQVREHYFNYFEKTMVGLFTTLGE